MLRQDSSKKAKERNKIEKTQKNYISWSHAGVSWRHLGGSWRRLGGILAALEGVLAALEGVLEALEGVLEAMLRQESSKKAQERKNTEKIKEK